MGESVPEASEADLAAQSDWVDDDDYSVPIEADIADVVEQHQNASLPDDDYDR